MTLLVHSSTVLVSILGLALCVWVIKRVVGKEGMSVRVFFQLEWRKVILFLAVAILSFFLMAVGMGLIANKGLSGSSKFGTGEWVTLIVSAIFCWPAIPGIWMLEWVEDIGILYWFWAAVAALVYWYFLACLVIACLFKVRPRGNDKGRASSALGKWLFVGGGICLLVIAAVTVSKFLLAKHCKALNTSGGLGLCLSKPVRASGEIRCNVSADWEEETPYLVLDDGSSLKLFAGYPERPCEYDGDQVTVYGDLYQCREEDACRGIGLHVWSIDYRIGGSDLLK